ncbi:MAG TPA: hypothetical protein DD624_07330 [Alphaproteobacteria bacterium]|nr:hypothetical protein [Alphaproteobacteria bacterium]
MTKDEEQELRKAFTFENFMKLLWFVNGCVGEGWQIGKVCSDELLYYDVLKDVDASIVDFNGFDKDTNTFLGIY